MSWADRTPIKSTLGQRNTSHAKMPTELPIPSGLRQRLVTQHAINALMCNKWEQMNLAFMPKVLLPSVVEDAPSHIKHFALPIFHPMTGKTISSYNQLMNDPMTAEKWQMAFGKDFSGMVQGDNKTGPKGANATFVIMYDEIKHMLQQNKKFTYGNPVVDYRPQKEDPNRIQIRAGGNLATYESSPLVCTADFDTAKLHWNSVIRTTGAQYMCLDIKLFYLTARLKFFEYMRMPLVLFPE